LRSKISHPITFQFILHSNLATFREDLKEYRTYNHRTAYLIVNGGKLAIFEAQLGKSERAISGVLDKQSDVFIIKANTSYRVALQTKKAQVVEGHEVLDTATRDRWIVSGEIEWDDDVNSEHIGKVSKEVVDEGDVTDRVQAKHKAAEDEKARLNVEDEQ
jgi:hypothetical protein